MIALDTLNRYDPSTSALHQHHAETCLQWSWKHRQECTGTKQGGTPPPQTDLTNQF